MPIGCHIDIAHRQLELLCSTASFPITLYSEGCARKAGSPTLGVFR